MVQRQTYAVYKQVVLVLTATAIEKFSRDYQLILENIISSFRMTRWDCSWGDMPEAARIGDQVEHTQAMAGLLAGAVAGAVIGAAIVLTAGAAAPAIAAAAVAAGTGASLGGGLGQLIGSLFSTKTGPISKPCAGTVFINGRRAARSAGPGGGGGDLVDCSKDDSDEMIAEGSASVFIEWLPAARRGDRVTCGSKIAEGSPDVIIGGGTFAYTDEIDSEVPWYAEAALLGLGLVGGVGAIALAGKAMRVITACKFGGSLVGGWGLGYSGNWLGGRMFGEGSRGQNLTSFGAGVVGSILGGRLGGSKTVYGQVEKLAIGPRLPNRDLTQSGWPTLPGREARNFTSAKPIDLPPGTKIYRIHDGNGSNGSWWAFELPKSKTLWRRDYAVAEQWKSPGSHYSEYVVGKEGLKIWQGPASGQMNTEGGFVVPGGSEQIWMPRGTISPPPESIPTGW
jgi:uncharacterized Zn-binding protein involved in type VI secretion